MTKKQANEILDLSYVWYLTTGERHKFDETKKTVETEKCRHCNRKYVVKGNSLDFCCALEA